MKIVSTVVFLAALQGILSAASWVVWPGESLQAAIDAAAPGDNITVQSGSYGESITINKGLDIRAENGVASFLGKLVVTNPTLPVYLAGLYFGGVDGVGATISGGNTDLRMDRCAIQEGASFGMTDGKFYAYKGNFSGPATFSGTDWTTQRSQFAQSLTSSNNATGSFIGSSANSLTHNGKDLTVFQSTVTEKTAVTIASGQGKAWLAYSTFRYMEMTGGCEIVGNHFNMRSPNRAVVTSDFPRQSCVTLSPNGGSQTFSNNIVFGAESVVLRWYLSGHVNLGTRKLNLEYYGYPALVISDSSGVVDISNNIFYSSFTSAVRAIGSTTSLKIRSNYHVFSAQTWPKGSFTSENINGGVGVAFIGKVSDFSIKSENAQAIITNNITSHGINGGIASDNQTGTVSFLNTTTPTSSNFFRPAADSPAIDAGPDMAIYTDLDGSRNDVGAYGGHSYDPTGRTTTKPVILSGSVDPLYVKRGGSVTIEARAAVVAEP